MDVYTSRHERITLADKAFASGGEGEVRAVQYQPSRFKNICVKLYYQKKRTSLQESKIKYMVENPPMKVEGKGFLIGWPLDYVTDADGNFMGFIMPLAYSDSQQLIVLTTPNLSKKLGEEWFDRYDRANGKSSLIARLKLLNNIAIPIYFLHSTGKYVLKDFKPENVLVTHDGKVSLVDMDSVQISCGSRMLFPGTAATSNYIPPEYYSKGVGKSASVPLNKSWDDFAVGVVFYQILFGLHPYVVTPSTQYDSGCSEIYQNIARNLFPYGENKAYINSFPNLHRKFEVLPASLKQMFLNVFSDDADRRPTAEDWGKEIHKLIVNAEHVSRLAPQPTPQNNTPHKPKCNPQPSLQPTYQSNSSSKDGQTTDFYSSLFSFNGRSRRSRYWLTTTVIISLDFLAWGIAFFVAGKDEYRALGILLLLQCPLLWLRVANIIKRLHDLGKSGAWAFLYLIPLINFGLAIYLLFFDGEHADNEYGPSPY